MTHDVELAVRTREALVEAVTHRYENPASSERAGPATRTSVAVDLPPVTRSQHLDERIRRVLRRSLHIRHLAAGSDNGCDWEIAALLNPLYDIQRLGIDFVASPRHADLLLVTGAVTRHLEPALYATYDAMPAPRLVVAVGSEACSGGLLQGSYAVAGGVDRCLPVDVYIPGDPPSPQALIHGLLVALDRLEPKVTRREWVVGH
jgi:Ni,Fe-hydrogenase III small subunit